MFCRPDGDPWHPDYVTETSRELILPSDLPRIRPLQDMRIRAPFGACGLDMRPSIGTEALIESVVAEGDLGSDRR